MDRRRVLSQVARRSLARPGGFSLIELIIAIVLLGLLAAVGTSMLSSSFDTTYMINASQTSAEQARYTLERLEREIREVKAGSITTATASRMVFTRDIKVSGASDVATVVTICGNDATCTGGTAFLTINHNPPDTTSTLSSQLIDADNNPATIPLLSYYKADGSKADGTSQTGRDEIAVVEINLIVRDTSKDGQQNIAQRTRVALRNKAPS